LRHLPRGSRFVERPVADAGARRRFLQTTLSTSAFLSTDVLIVGALLGSAILAPYALATKMVATLGVLPVAISRVSLSWAARGEGGGAAPELRTAARLGLAIALVLVPVGTLAIGTAGAALAMLIAETLSAALYAGRHREDGWTLRELLPSTTATLGALGAACAAVLLPPYSLLVLPLAAVAALLALGPSDLYRRLRTRQAEARPEVDAQRKVA
jgi:hypothetical protein